MADARSVLVVDDDASMRRVISAVLGRDGFSVETLGDGRLVAEAIRAQRPDVVVLDLGLPDVNGFDVLRQIRADSDVPVLVLSGRGAESDRVLALELGADDYVVKPFLNGELVARVRARLRRPTAVRPDDRDGAVLGDESLRIDPVSREVTLDGHDVAVTAREFDLLEHLAGSPRRVFSRQQLTDALGGGDLDGAGESAVTEHVHRLRKKLGADRIVTVRGIGYRFDPVG